jgi:hypothetical protein
MQRWRLGEPGAPPSSPADQGAEHSEAAARSTGRRGPSRGHPATGTPKLRSRSARRRSASPQFSSRDDGCDRERGTALARQRSNARCPRGGGAPQRSRSHGCSFQAKAAARRDRRGRRPAVESHRKGQPARRLSPWLRLSDTGSGRRRRGCSGACKRPCTWLARDGSSSAVERSRSSFALSAQLKSAVRRAAITAAERREVFGAASFRIVPRLQRRAFGVDAHSRLVRTGRDFRRGRRWCSGCQRERLGGDKVGCGRLGSSAFVSRRRDRRREVAVLRVSSTPRPRDPTAATCLTRACAAEHEHTLIHGRRDSRVASREASSVASRPGRQAQSRFARLGVFPYLPRRRSTRRHGCDGGDRKARARWRAGPRGRALVSESTATVRGGRQQPRARGADPPR